MAGIERTIDAQERVAQIVFFQQPRVVIRDSYEEYFAVRGKHGMGSSGKKEIVATAISNCYERCVLFSIDVDSIGG